MNAFKINSASDGIDLARNLTLTELSRKKATEMTFSVIYLAILMVVGLLGNGFVLKIYYFRFHPSTHRCFILVLAFYDFFACAVGAPFSIAEMFFEYTYRDVVSCKIFRFILYYTCIASSLTLVLIAFERFRKICRPLKRQMAVSGAKKALFVVVGIVSTLSASPALVIYGNETIPTGYRNMTGTKCFISDIFKQTVWPTVFNVYLSVLALVSTVCMATCYVCIARQVSKMGHAKINKRGASYDKNDNQFETVAKTTYDDKIDDIQTRVIRGSLKSKYTDKPSAIPIRDLEIAEKTLYDGKPNENMVLRLENAGKTADDNVEDKLDDNQTSVQDISEYNTDEKLNESQMCEQEMLDDKTYEVHLEQTSPSSITATESLLKNSNKVVSKSDSNSSTSKWASNAKRILRTMSSKSARKTLRITKMLTLVTVAFVVSYTPHLTLMLWSVFKRHEVEALPPDVYQVIFYSFFINNLVNPLIYAAMDIKFRRELSQIYNCR